MRMVLQQECFVRSKSPSGVDQQYLSEQQGEIRSANGEGIGNEPSRIHPLEVDEDMSPSKYEFPMGQNFSLGTRQPHPKQRISMQRGQLIYA